MASYEIDGKTYFNDSSPLNTLRSNDLNIEQRGNKIVIDADTPESQQYLHTNKTDPLMAIAFGLLSDDIA